MSVNIVATEKNKNIVKLNSKLADELNIYFLRDSSLRFGFKIKDVTVNIDDKTRDNEIIISKNVIDSLNIPINCNYELIIHNNEIVIGPFIGIYAGQKKETLIKKVRLMRGFIEQYNKFNGCVFLFCYNTLNKSNLTVEGFYYDPQNDRWIYDTLPYPSMIFKRGLITKQQREYLGSLYGDKIFNYKVFEKWEMYNRMKKFKEVKPFLPVTEVYKDDVQLIDLINKYNDVYVKPIGGRGGKGIYNILKIDEEKYKIKTTVGKNITEQVYENLNEVKNFFISNFQKDKYIIQQTIDVKNNNKVFDFRVGYDKDLYGNWNRIMFVTRVGGNNSVVSNYKAGGSLMYPEDALKEFYNLSDEKVEEYKEKIFKVGDIILNALEKTSKHFGKVALDLIMDKNGGVWLVEINMRYPDDTLKNSLDDDRETYKKIRLTNMQYCKYLSGFSNKNNPTNVSIDNKIDEGQSQHSYKIYFYGKVQGVNFRKTLKRIGNEEKIDVKATNLKNKHIVKAEITVEDSTLEKFISKAKSENKKAKVNSISIIKNNH